MEVGDKKLLVLHLKGFLVDRYHEYSRTEPCPSRRPHAKCNHYYVYKRPGADEFLQFCFQNFVVGVWSAAHEHNVMALLDFTFGALKKELAFIWTYTQCTDTGLTHTEKAKPLVRKELSKLWTGEHRLRWGKGVFGASNTILIDDDPTKIEENPPNTAIILKTYRVTDPEDDQLGKLQKYLELLEDADDVQKHMKTKPFEKFELAGKNSAEDLPAEDFNLDDSQSLDFLITKALSLKVGDDSSSKTAPPDSAKMVKSSASTVPMHRSSQEIEESRKDDSRQRPSLATTEGGKSLSIRFYSHPKVEQTDYKQRQAKPRLCPNPPPTGVKK